MELMPQLTGGVPAVAKWPTQRPGLGSTRSGSSLTPSASASTSVALQSSGYTKAPTGTAWPTQHPELGSMMGSASTPSTSVAPQIAPTGNVSSLSRLAARTGISVTEIKKHLVNIRNDLGGKALCTPCWVQCSKSNHDMEQCGNFAKSYLSSGSRYKHWKATWDIPQGTCYGCCLPQARIFSFATSLCLMTFLRLMRYTLRSGGVKTRIS
jgi:hypothetical protein